MKTFKEMAPVLSEETVRNKHLDHIEDLMFKGPSGLRMSIAFLKDIAKSLKTGKTGLGMSTKWDGKPAVVCGINPSNKKFFVATKGAFNKTVKAFHTEAEVKKGIPNPDLADKLIQCLKHLPKIGIKGVLQGDLMFTESTKKRQTIDGKDYITFMPNTIMYAIDPENEIGKRVNSAKVGIAFHTMYSGRSMESLSASSFNFNSSSLKKSADVWFTDPNIYDITPALLKPEEYDSLSGMIKECEAKARIVAPFMKVLAAKGNFVDEYLSPYVNSTINGGLSQFSSGGLSLHIKTKIQKHIAKLKTPKGKTASQNELNQLLSFVSAYDSQFNAMFELHNMIAKAKEVLLGKFYALSRFGHFFVDDDGIRPTDPEGIVIARSGKVVKLVNRLRFSRQNRKVNA